MYLGMEFKDALAGMIQMYPKSKGLEEFVADTFEIQRKLPEIRKALRGKSSIVPNAPAHVTVRTLGKTQIKVGDHVLTTADWRTQMSRDFFLYLLAHPEGATKEEIVEVFLAVWITRIDPLEVQEHHLPRPACPWAGLHHLCG